MAQGRGYGSSRRGGVARAGPLAEGYFRHNTSGDPKSCTGPGHNVLRPPGNQHAEPNHPGFPADHLQAPRERSLFHLSPVSSPSPCAIIIKSVSSV